MMDVKTLLSAEAVLEMGDIGRWELVKGELIKMTPAGGTHGELTANVARVLGNFVKPRKLGKVFGAETGFYTSHDPDTLRGADAMFYSNERVEESGDLTGFLRLAPDLAVEVISPGDTWDEVEEKVAEHLSAGVRLIWIVTPKTQSVHAYRPRKEALRLSREDTLTGEDVLPGFEISVAELFE
jgi:Uma2 family endonuclease